MAAARPAHAQAPTIVQSLDGPVCPLPYSPYTHETATPHATYCDNATPDAPYCDGSATTDFSYLCSLDEDRDGLDDHIENLIAQCFAPYLRFDTRENAFHFRQALPDGHEPLGLYTVEPTEKHNRTASLRWVLVFDNDGGFESVDVASILPAEVAFEDKHKGDTQLVTMRVNFEEAADGAWDARLVMVHTGSTWEQGTQNVSDTGIACYKISGGPAIASAVGLVPTVIPDPDPFAILVLRGCEPSTAHVLHLELADDHPVVYLSAGKHHTFLHPQSEYPWKSLTAEDPIFGDFTYFAERDRANGQGRQFQLSSHGGPDTDYQPLNVGRIQTSSTVPADTQDQACKMAKEDITTYLASCNCTAPGCPVQAPQSFCNAFSDEIGEELNACGKFDAKASNQNLCLKTRRNLDVAAHFVSDYQFHDVFGYGGSLSNTKGFCGRDAPGSSGCPSVADCTPIVKWLGWTRSDLVDEDGDGIADFSDRCPLNPDTSQEPDFDQDGFGNSCDPYPHHYDRWVGRGSPVKHLPAFVAAWPHNNPGLNGFLDSDEDGKANGNDMCPFTAASTVDTNQRSEELAFRPDSHNWTHYGYSYRGNACDPFETAFVHPLFENPGTSQWTDCYYAKPGVDQVTTSSNVQINYAAVAGLSANDPALFAPPNTYSSRASVLFNKSKTVPVTLERCACLKDDWGTCAHDAQSPCRVDLGLKGHDPNPAIHRIEDGWHPLGPVDCSENPFTGYCRPISVTARPTIPRDCDLHAGNCNFPPSDWDPWETQPQRLLWNWQAEHTKHPDHLPDLSGPEQDTPADLFYEHAGLPGQPSYLHSKHPFMFGSEVAREASQVEGSPYYWKYTNEKPYLEPRQPGQEPDADISVNQLPGFSFPGQQTQARRLRSYFALFGPQYIPAERPYLTAAHQISLINPNTNPCVGPGWSTIDIHQRLVDIIWPPDPEGGELVYTSPISLVSQPRGFVLVASRPGVAPLADMLQLSTGHAYPVLVTALDYGAPTNGGLSAMAAIGSGTDLARLLDAAPGGADVVPLATPKDESSPLPELLVVEYSDATTNFPGTWFTLSPLGIDPTAGASYSIRGVGLLPADFEKGVLRSDTIPGAAVEFVEPGPNRDAGLWRFEADEWSETPLPAELPQREHAAYLLHDAVLFRAGGSDNDGNLVGDTLALETRSGREYGQTPDWAARSEPALAWDEERGGLVYGGGFDASAAPHGDLWVAGLQGVAPELLVPDASGPDAPRVDSASLVLAGAHSRQALVLGTSRVPGPIAGAWRGAADGWHPQSLLSLDTGTGMDRCADASTPRLCADGASDWWGDPGHLACSPAAAGVCTSASQPMLVGTQQLPVQQARSADLDVMTTWVGADTHVEDWSDSDPPVLRGRIGVSAPVIRVRARDGSAAVATRRGLVMVSRDQGKLRASDPLPLCGRPLAAEPLPGGRWIVSTSAGVALVSVDYTGTPSVDQVSLLLPDNGGWSAFYVSPAECASHAVCRVADKIVCAGGRCGDGRARAPLALVGDRVALAPALGSSAGWLHGAGVKPATYGDLEHPPVLLLGRDGDGFHVLSEAHVDGTVQALRASGAWVYAVSEAKHGKHIQRFTPALGVIDDQFASADTHDVPWWVQRRDMPDRRLRLVNGGVEVAEIQP